MEWIINEKSKKVITTVLFILSVFLILFHFTDTPKVWVDEGIFTETARNLATHGVIGLQTAPGQYFSMRNLLLTTSYPVIFPVATSFYFFGVGIVQARLPMVIYIFLFILFSFLFVKRRFGFVPAVLSILLLLSFSPLYGNGRPVQGEVPGLALFLIGLWSLLFYEESSFSSHKWTILSGFFLGLASADKPIFLICIVFALFCNIFLYFKKIQNKKTIITFSLGFLLPLFLWLYIHFPTLDSIKKIIPTFLYFGSNHGSNSSTLSKTLITNFSRFFTESTPILFSFLAGVIVIYVIFKMFRKELNNFSITETTLLISIAVNWITYLFGTGWYRYFFPAHTLLYILFPAYFLILIGSIKKEWLKKLFLIVPMLLMTFQFYDLIFLSDTSFVVSRTRNIELYNTLSKIDPTKKVLLYNVPETAIFLKGDNYSQYIEMDTFLIAGDHNILQNTSADYILTDADQSSNVSLRCYTQTKLSQYYFLEKQSNCKVR